MKCILSICSRYQSLKMKATFFTIACLVFLATSALAEEEEYEISELRLPLVTNAQQACVDKIARPSRNTVEGINRCLRANAGLKQKQFDCIKKIRNLKTCFVKVRDLPAQAEGEEYEISEARRG